MTYTITEINHERGWVQFDVTFDDKTTLTKRMMSPLDSKAAMTGAIERWIVDYQRGRKAKAVVHPSVSALVGKTMSVKGGG